MAAALKRLKPTDARKASARRRSFPLANRQRFFLPCGKRVNLKFHKELAAHEERRAKG
jgi:hypothetical protein